MTNTQQEIDEIERDLRILCIHKFLQYFFGSIFKNTPTQKVFNESNSFSPKTLII